MPVELDAKIAAATAARQTRNVGRADRLARRIGRLVDDRTRALLRLIRDPPDTSMLHRRVTATLDRLYDDIRTEIGLGLANEVATSYETALAVWVASLPMDVWAVMLEERGVRPVDVRESRNGDVSTSGKSIQIELTEQRARILPTWPAGTVPTRAQVDRFIRQSTIRFQGGREQLTAGLTVFRPPPPDAVAGIIRSTQWRDGRVWDERLTDLSKLAPPSRIADDLVRGIAAAEAPAKLALRLRPALAGVHASAARVARTESLRVANQVSRRQWLSVEIVIGAQILSVLGETTRPHHAARQGTMYFKEGHGTPTLVDMPAVPDEPNCLCWDSPIFSEPDVSQFRSVKGPEIDPGEMTQQWRRFSLLQQRRFVGARRHKVVADKLTGKRPPEFADFIDPQTGKLLPTTHLHGEELWRLERRSAAVRKTIEKRGRDVQIARSRAISKGPRFVQPTPRQIDDIIAQLGQETETAKAIAKPTAPEIKPTDALDPANPGPEFRRRLIADEAANPAELQVREAFDQVERTWRDRREWMPQLQNLDAVQLPGVGRVGYLMDATGEVSISLAADSGSGLTSVARAFMGKIDLTRSNALNVRRNMIRANAENLILRAYGHREQTLERVRDVARLRWRAILKVDNPARFRFTATPKIKAAAEFGADDLRPLLAHREAFERPGLTVRTKGGNRGSYSRNQIKLGGRASQAWNRRTMTHELGHWLDDIEPDTNRRTQAFLRKRTAGQPVQKMTKLEPGSGYKSHEISRPDNFKRPYMGKEYGTRSSEITSMGLEFLTHDPVNLARRDPEYFDLIVRIARGLPDG